MWTQAAFGHMFAQLLRKSIVRVEEALPKLQAACGKRFSKLFANHPTDLRTNKGHVGQLLLLHIGCNLDSELCDFENGELKTNKCSADGRPLETMFITQVNGLIDQLLSNPQVPFASSPLYQKIKRILYVPVVKESPNVGDWYFIRCIDIRVPIASMLFKTLEQDYNSICRQLREHVSSANDGFIHTSSGKYLQIRSKDSKPYHPIYSSVAGRAVSDKNHAFYFQKKFMEDALANVFD
jgi:DNA mismatch repair protein MutH